MRVRQLFPADARDALDVDLVWGGSSEVDEGPEITARLRHILATEAHDGVTFGTDRIRVDAMHVRGALAGYRYILRSRVDRAPVDVMIDVRTDLKPRASYEAIRVERGEGAILLCRPETILRRKLEVILEAGRTRWRPKDLHDVHRLLGSLGNARIGSAIENLPLGELLAESWWREPRSRSRWRMKSWLHLPEVVAPVCAKLARLGAPT